MNKIFIYLFFTCQLIFSAVNASINFVHIPKTAGTTLYTILESNFKKVECYPSSPKGVTPPPYPRKLIQSNNFDFTQEEADNSLNIYPMINHKLVCGHFPMWFFKEKDPNFEHSYFITVLREPVDRVLSHYNYLKDKRNGNVKSPLDISQNMLCRMLCSDLSLKGEALLENSIQNLHRMDFIIFQDDFENGVKKLFLELNLNLKNNVVPYKNCSERNEVSDEVLQKIEKMNDLDIQLYEYADRYLRKKFSS